MRQRHGVGSNQYRIREGGPQKRPDASHRRGKQRCGDLWGTRCRAWIYPPSWKHDAAPAHYQHIDVSAAPADTLRLFSESKDDRIIRAVVASPNCPPDILLAFCDGPAASGSVQQDLFISGLGNPNYPRHQLAHWYDQYKLSLDPDGPLGAIFSNPSCPESVFTEASDRHIDDGLVPLFSKMARNPNCPPNVMARLATQTSLTSQLLENPNCPPNVIDYLYNRYFYSDSIDVFVQIAKHVNTPESILSSLADSPHPDVMEAIVGNPSCKDEGLVKLVQRGAVPIRKAIAKRRDCPEEALAALACDPSVHVRRIAYDNPRMPDHLRAVMLLAE